MIILLLQYGPAAIGLLLALGALFVHRRSRANLPLAARISTAVGMVIALGCMIAFTVWSVFPAWVPPLGDDGFLILQLARYLFPLILCAVALVFLIVPVPSRGPRGSAELAPRTFTTFASRRWLGSAAGVIVAIATLSVLAGLASSPDDAGRYVMFEVQASSSASAGTTMYGWWFSLPCLTLVALIVTITLFDLVVISRPALDHDTESDTSTRTARVRNVLAVSTGGLLLHLGAVLQSLYGTSTLHMGLEAGQAGWVELGTSFAAIGPVLLVASFVSVILGMAMWWSTLLTVVPARARQSSKFVLT
jgi:hypothetical protein